MVLSTWYKQTRYLIVPVLHALEDKYLRILYILLNIGLHLPRVTLIWLDKKYDRHIFYFYQDKIQIKKLTLFH